MRYPKIEEPTQPPRRPAGFYQGAIRELSCAAVLAGLTAEETAICACQFAGLTIAGIEVDLNDHAKILAKANDALRSSYGGKMAVRSGVGRPARER